MLLALRLPPQVSSSTFSGNRAGGAGGALLLSAGASLRLVNSTIDTNAAGGYAAGSAAALAASARQGVLNQGPPPTCPGGQCAGSGGGIFLGRGAAAVIASSVFLRNAAGGTGGACAVSSSASASLEDSRLTGNTATVGGGALDVGGAGRISVARCAISNSTAYAGAFVGVGPDFASLTRQLLFDSLTISNMRASFGTLYGSHGNVTLFEARPHLHLIPHSKIYPPPTQIIAKSAPTCD